MTAIAQDDGVSVPAALLGRTEKYAVYRCYSDDGSLLYVGVTGDLGRRFASHAQKLWFVQVRGITLEWYADEVEALKAERRAIHVEHPRYNVQHRNTVRISRNSVGRKRGKRTAARRPDPAETMEAARAILACEPDLSGSELGRRLGMTDRWGRDIKGRLAVR